MRILIIGEYSSFAKNLSEGFRQLGHECFVFSWGDGFKKIKQDSNFSYTINARYQGGGLLSFFFYILKSFISFLHLRDYVNNRFKAQKNDVIIILNLEFVKKKYHFWQARFSKKMILDSVKNPENIFLSSCGNDVPYFDYWSKNKWKNEDLIKKDVKKYLSTSNIKHLKYCNSFVNKVIPISYGYAEAWRKSKYSMHYTVIKTIPLPIDSSKISVTNVLGDKIVIFHGISRPVDKGTKYIKEALDCLQRDYADVVECRAEGGLPLDEYLKLLDRTNILIDQALADTAAMNALYGLAMGKVVLGGNEEENQKEYNEYDCPVVNIIPDHNQIYNELVKLVTNRSLIEELSLKSRMYVERVHDSKVIAQKYLEIFTSIT